MIQLDKRVKRMGLGFSLSFLISDIWTFMSAGYIIKKRQIPIGIDIPWNCHESMVSPIFGIYFERSNPIPMQTTTHTTRYFSKMDSISSPLSSPLEIREMLVFSPFVFFWSSFGAFFELSSNFWFSVI